MRKGRPRAQWRGWEATDEHGVTVVTSARLAAGAPVKNRWFPKIRSWVALGAPLELLSPLSAARVLLAFGLLLTLGVPAGGQGPSWPSYLVLAAAVVAMVAALRLRQLRPFGCHLVVLGGIGGSMLLMLDAGEGPASIMAGLFLFPLAVFAGLFLHPRAVVAYQGGVAASLFICTVAIRDVASAIGVTVVVGLAWASVGLTIAVVTYSARRSSELDPDTGLPNGFGLAELLDDLGDEPYVIVTMVLRGLGEAREALGYQVGTELIRRAVEDVGQVLPSDAVVARVAGDELVVAQPIPIGANPLPSDDPKAAARLVMLADARAAVLADQLAGAISASRYLAAGVDVVLRAHLGIAVAPIDGDDPTEVIRRASVAAHHAMAAGLVQSRWNGTDGALTSADLALLADLRLAPERGELWVAYQPQISAATGLTVAVEALMRWTSPRHGTVPPGIFIPLAERVGLIDRLTDWILADVLDAQIRWVEQGRWLPVSVNISAISLSDPGLSDRVLNELSSRSLPPGLLNVEVTETAAVDVIQAVDRLRPLHDHGVRVSIDDFGTGYTSLSVLPHLPIDELKVDQRFVLATPHSPADLAIVEAVSDLAHRLGLEAVAEGVEDEGISDRMRAIGFDLLQGYHFARPMAEKDLLLFVDGAEGGAAAASHTPARSGGRVERW